MKTVSRISGYPKQLRVNGKVINYDSIEETNKAFNKYKSEGYTTDNSNRDFLNLWG